MHTRTKELTQAAFSTVVSVVILALGFQLTFGEYFWYFCACIALSIPVSNRWKVCCFVTVSALSIMLCPSYLYLCSYILWLGPYALIQCATESMPGVLRFFIRYVCFLAGAVAVLWTTPMLFVQLSSVSKEWVIPALLIAAAAAIPLTYLYSILYERVSHAVRERILRLL
ncbi:MAG: hypothetical protein CW338_09910 [Clostridiales bacterium]|nr:hypothetical protein [Clostridiales bacterium]